MEIYNLKDEIPEGKEVRRNKTTKDEGIFDEKLAITDLKQGVKNPNRVNVFVNEKYAFSLDVAQVVDFKLKIGLMVSEEQLVEYKKASEFGKLYQRALEWVLVRPRSVRELKDYLLRKKIKKSSSDTLRSRLSSQGSLAIIAPVVAPMSSEDIFDFSQEIIDKLIAKGYVDDRKFAEYYVENRFVKKGISQKRLRQELMKKGVAREIIEKVLVGRDDTEEIKKMIARKRDKYDDDKLVAYLCRQGFSYDLVRKLVNGG